MATKETHPFLFTPDAGIDRRKSQRTLPMEVLCLGMSRTGTTSMRAALYILGYKSVYHGKDVYANIKDCDMWADGLRFKFHNGGSPLGRTEFDQLLGHCDAITAAPPCAFAAELIEAYPDAKVVICERNVETWLPSFDMFIDNVYGWKNRVLQYTDPVWMGRIQNVGWLWMTGQFRATTAEECRRNARMAYKAHYANIRKICPKERLLDFQMKDGWEPLCTLLGKEIPNVPFPRVNEAAMLKKQLDMTHRRAFKNSLWNLVYLCSILLVAGLFGWWAML